MHPESQAHKGMLPDRDEVLRDVAHIVAEQMGMQVESVTANAALADDLGCDSLDIVEISMQLEEHFDISIPDEFGETTRTIGDVTDGILQLLAASRQR